MNKDSAALGRMYLITDDQFNDVVLQENERPVDGKRIIPPFEALCEQAESVLPDIRLYGRLLNVGERDAHPVLTFTATKSDLPIAPPSEAYLKLIVAGLEETYPCMKKGEIRDYLSVAPGIHDKIPIEQLTRWILDK